MILYYNNAMADGDINNVSNWWDDSLWTTPAAGLPTNGDDIYIDGDVSTPFLVLLTYASCVVGSINTGVFSVNLSNLEIVSGSIQIAGSAILSQSTSGQDYTFNDNTKNGATCDSSCTFLSLAENLGTTSGYTGFSGSSQNGATGTVNGLVEFYGASLNLGVCNNVGAPNIAFFHDTSLQSGTVNGDAQFMYAAPDGFGQYVNVFQQGYGQVTGAILDTTGNQIYTLIYDNFNHNGLSNGGGIATIAFLTNSENTGIIENVTYVSFDSTSKNMNTVSVLTICYFDEFTNFGEVNGDVQFVNASQVNGVVQTSVTTGTGEINGTIMDDSMNPIEKISYNSGLSGTSFVDAIFPVNGFNNSGNVTGSAYFYNGAYSIGTITGTAHYMDAISTLAGIANTSPMGGASGTKIPYADILGTGLQ